LEGRTGPQPVQAMIGRDPVKPGRHRGSRPELTGMYIGLEEDFLGGILGFQAIPQEPLGEPVNPALVPPHQLCKGLLITADRSAEQGMVKIRNGQFF